VFGKAGRAETATDPAPLEMFETTIQFKRRDQWRAGLTQDQLVEELDRIVGRARALERLGAAHQEPDRHARHRDQEPVGIKVSRDQPRANRRRNGANRARRRALPGVTSAFAERLTGGRYIDVDVNRDAAARFGLNVADVQSVVAGPRSAARTSARPSRVSRASRSTCAIRARFAIRSTT